MNKLKKKKFIKNLVWNTYLSVKTQIKSKRNWDKLRRLIVYFFEISVTGMLLFYTITHFNWLSVGLCSAFAMHYFEYIVNTIKGNKEKG